MTDSDQFPKTTPPEGDLGPEPLQKFGDRLSKARTTSKVKSLKASPADDEAAAKRSGAMGIAMRLSTDMIAAVIVGTGAGWLIDNWLGTSPFGLLIFFVLGVAAGGVNVVRTAQRLNEEYSNQPPGADK